MFTPGGARSTLVAPKFEKEASGSLSSVGGPGMKVQVFVIGGVVRRRVVVRAVVARRGDEQVPGGVRPGDGILQGLGLPAPAPRVVGYLDPVCDGVVQRRHGVRRIPALRTEELERHDPGPPVDAGHTDAVVALGCYGA